MMREWLLDHVPILPCIHFVLGETSFAFGKFCCWPPPYSLVLISVHYFRHLNIKAHRASFELANQHLMPLIASACCCFHQQLLIPSIYSLRPTFYKIISFIDISAKTCQLNLTLSLSNPERKWVFDPFLCKDNWFLVKRRIFKLELFI